MRRVIIFILFFSLNIILLGEEAGIFRYPDIHNDKIAFVYAGNIYISPVDGGVARQLTSHPGKELFPKFSPDGNNIAFTGEYDGTRQVFIINLKSSELKQLTWYNDVGVMPPRGGFDNQIMGWSPDGKNILFRANRTPYGKRMGRFYVVPAEGGLETPLEIPESGEGEYAENENKIVYTPISRSFRNWKRYRGGRAQDVWIYDLKNHKSTRITENQTTDYMPMWFDNKIYFLSDRSGTLNLYSINSDKTGLKELTSFNRYDVLWPGHDENSIVYEMGGDIYRMNKQGESKKIVIQIINDRPLTFPKYVAIEKYLESYDLQPGGKKVVLTARGEVLESPQKGIMVNFSKTVDFRERDAVYSPDGNKIVWQSDASGEYELYIYFINSGILRKLSSESEYWRFQPVFSPNGQFLAYGTRLRDLRILNIATAREKIIAKDKYGDITEYQWSPDSKWLAYTVSADNLYASIRVYNLDKKKAFSISNGEFNDFNPIFDPSGNYLYFISLRSFNLNFSSFEFTYQYENAAKVYALALSRKSPPLKGYPGFDKVKKSKESKHPRVAIDFEGMQNRIYEVTEKPGQYSNLDASKNGVFYVSRNPEHKGLYFYDLKKKNEKLISAEINHFQMDVKKEYISYRKGNEIFSAEANGGMLQGQKGISLKGEITIYPRREWEQIFTDGWRIVRDWFYDPNMHGVDWLDMKEKYQPLVKRISSRADLDFILGELIGELNSSHTYVGSGDEERVARTPGGLLGCDFVKSDTKYFQFGRIFSGENWDDSRRSPLLDMEVNIHSGDYLIAIDGDEVTSNDNPYKFLANKANQYVELMVNKSASRKGARKVMVKTISSELELRYINWVKQNREKTTQLSAGKVGYIHLPNTANEGNRELYRWFYTQVNKEALIIDARYNGGGFIPGNMIDLLDRKLLNFWARRGVESSRTPAYVHIGPKACLINHYSSSGGDAFPYYFRERGLGKLIGTRTWGGLIGLAGQPGLVDGGVLMVPSFRFYDNKGNWKVENKGVSPDIEIWDLPEEIAAGKDPSLEKAVEVLLDELEKNPVKSVMPQSPPDESKKK